MTVNIRIKVDSYIHAYHSNKLYVKRCLLKFCCITSGAAAGIAIAFLVAGIGLGVLIIFIINKVKGGSLPNLTLSFSPKTYSSET